MLKSEMFKKAQMAVLSAGFLEDADKLDIIGVLMSEENIQRMIEAERAKESEVAPY